MQPHRVKDADEVFGPARQLCVTVLDETDSNDKPEGNCVPRGAVSGLEPE